jgi:type IV secretory pathway VirB10-like protein
MKRHAMVAIVLVAVVSTACQREATRTADAGAASPAPPAASASPVTAVTPAQAEAAPSPLAAAPAEAPAVSQAPRAPVPGATAAPAAVEPAAPVVEPPAADPTPAPTPTPRPRVVATGTALKIVLQQAVSTKTAKAEDPVVAELAEDVSVDGDVLLPAGSEVRGHVVSALRSGRVKGKAHLVVAFDEIHVGSRSYTISATGFDVTAGSSKGKDAKIAGGAAAAGVVIGAIAGGGSGAAKGGLIGGAAGGAAVLATRGVEVELASGSEHTIKLQKSLRLKN